MVNLTKLVANVAWVVVEFTTSKYIMYNRKVGWLRMIPIVRVALIIPLETIKFYY